MILPFQGHFPAVTTFDMAFAVIPIDVSTIMKKPHDSIDNRIKTPESTIVATIVDMTVDMTVEMTVGMIVEMIAAMIVALIVNVTVVHTMVEAEAAAALIIKHHRHHHHRRADTLRRATASVLINSLGFFSSVKDCR